MRKRVVFSLLFLLLPFLISLSNSFSETGRGPAGIRVTDRQGNSLELYKDYHALVVGVSEYEHWPKLRNAAKDAREVASALKVLGFKVTLVLNPGYLEMLSALRKLAYTMGSERERGLLFYFAGHGETLELADGTQLGFIIPRDCPLKSVDPIGFDSKAISMKEIETTALKVKSKHLLMVFDSCFSGTLFYIDRSPPADITEKSAWPVRQFITAGDAEEQVPDQSVFKKVFLQGINGRADLNDDGYVTGSELGMYLETMVVRYTNKNQHPKYGKMNNPELDKGDFVFVPPAKVAALPSPELQPPPVVPPLPEPTPPTPPRPIDPRERQEAKNVAITWLDAFFATDVHKLLSFSRMPFSIEGDFFSNPHDLTAFLQKNWAQDSRFRTRRSSHSEFRKIEAWTVAEFLNSRNTYLEREIRVRLVHQVDAQEDDFIVLLIPSNSADLKPKGAVFLTKTALGLKVFAIAGG